MNNKTQGIRTISSLVLLGIILSATLVAPAQAWSVKDYVYGKILGGATADWVKWYLESQGYQCYSKPWWIPIPLTYWYWSTCAIPASSR